VTTLLGNAAPLLDVHGRLRGAVGAFVDVTRLKHVEDALSRANTQLADADHRKDEFIAILSHELRNPLAPIRYALPILQRDHLTEAAERAVRVIDRQVDHLTRLVDDLLDVSRITRGMIELRKEHVTLGSVVNAAVEAASPGITAARHTLELAVSDEPVWLYADAARIAQVITNLLNNSAKYTPRGGRISLFAAVEDGRAVVRVRDTGIGIPAPAIATVFDMFRQVSRPDRSQGGLGIGLALARRLVEMHGGTIEAHSDGLGRGSVFTVRLPVATESRANDQPREDSTARAEGRRLRVLVVDDNADLVEMLAVIVESAGHEVRKALDGRSAVSAARSYRPDLVLLDLGLPVMSGLDVARELRRDPAMAGVRLVALTGWGQPEDRRQTEQAGFDAHLTKPADARRVELLLNEFAAASHRAAPGTA
jgi:signal transduction histidine kinase/ActR/RegA family two-component response regulator